MLWDKCRYDFFIFLNIVFCSRMDKVVRHAGIGMDNLLLMTGE